MFILTFRALVIFFVFIYVLLYILKFSLWMPVTPW